ncbi:MAG TPA: hypothetical protein VM840_01475, partial [Actinomycetota bacterium]|nr:hypothetical protein [Actinomycetota bacterium]
MSRVARTAGVVSVGGMAAAGLVLGHHLGYLLAFPDAAHRHRVLLETGHGYLAPLTNLVAVAFGAAIFASIVFGFVQGHRGWVSGAWARTWSRLFGVQAGGYVLMELVEQLATPGPADRLLRVLGVGLVVQAVVAAAGVLLIGFLNRAGRLAAEILAGPCPAARSTST